jgi:uncharacterized repeat protein (TIGR01451 family)
VSPHLPAWSRLLLACLLAFQVILPVSPVFATPPTTPPAPSRAPAPLLAAPLPATPTPAVVVTPVETAQSQSAMVTAQDHPLLALTLTLDPPWTEPGDVVTYTVVARNTGSTPLAGLVLSDTLPAGLRHVTHSESGFTYDPQEQRLTWPVGDLAAGAIITGGFRARSQGSALREVVTNTVAARSPQLTQAAEQASHAIAQQAAKAQYGGSTAPGGLDPKDFKGIGEKLAEKFKGTSGVDAVLQDLEMGGNRAQGASWQARYAIENLDPSDVVGFEQAGTTGRIDVVVRQGSRMTFLETKSINWYAISQDTQGMKAADIIQQVMGHAQGKDAFSKVVIESTGAAPQWFIQLLEAEGIIVEVFTK